MDLLSGEGDWGLLNDQWPMFTREIRTKLNSIKTRNAGVKSSMIHDCCTLEGYAERSVIFGGSEVGRYAKIKDSIIMPNAQIGRNVLIERAIIGEGAIIKDGAIIKGTSNEIIVIGPNETVLAKPAVRTQPSRLLKEVYDKTTRLRAEGLSS
ncbi:Glucose-1-phosphate adenylyltransferase [compost metagenome]